MNPTSSSSLFTNESASAQYFWPPVIGALLGLPWEAVQARMLERLHARGFADFDPAYLSVFQYPGPQGARPSELASRLRMSKQALNHLLGQLDRRGSLERRPDADDLRSKRVVLTSRGADAVYVIREAVTEIETEWEQQLGPKRFGQLHELLLDLTPSP